MATRNVLVCGAGLMGHGIAQVMAAAGYNVWIFEPELARAEAGRARIGANLERSVAKARITDEQRKEQLGRIAVAASLADAARGAELVVEAVFEDEKVKTRPLQGDRRLRAASGRACQQHELDLDHAPGRIVATGASKPLRGDALLLARAGDAADRADPRRRDRRFD